MNIQKMKVVALIAFSSLCLSVGFQNCSKVGVQDLSSSSDKVDGQGVPSDPNTEGTATIGDGPVPTTEMPPVVDAPPMTIPLPPQRPPVVDDGETCENHGHGNPPGNHGGGGNPTDHGGPQMPPGAQAQNDDDPEDDTILDNPTEEAAVALCMTAKASSTAGSVINHMRGHGEITVLQSQTLNLVNDIRGKFVIQGAGTGAKANAIVNTRGALIICNMRVNLLKNTRGQLILVNSKVDVLSDHRGNIRSINSEVGTWGDLRGKFHF